MTKFSARHQPGRFPGSKIVSMDDHIAEIKAAREHIEARKQDEHARLFEPLGPERCAHEKDALGHCLGPCQGEEWDR